MKIGEHVSLTATLAILFLVVFCSACRLFAGDVHADYVAGEKSAELVTPQVMAAAEFMGTDLVPMIHALKLQMTKYDLDMKTRAGRTAWHGRFVGEEIYTNELVKVEVYSNSVDGTVWRYRMPFRPVAPKATTRRTIYSTNGIPARLASARARRAGEIDAGTVVTNIETTANAPLK